MEDPAGITISQWTNLTTRHGIHQLELQLSSEPLQVKIDTKFFSLTLLLRYTYIVI